MIADSQVMSDEGDADAVGRSWNQSRTMRLANGRKISYSAAGRGQPVILVHGSVQDRRAWRYVARELSPFCQCVAYDRAGYGDSHDHHGRDDTIRRDAEDLLQVTSSLARCAVVGSSYGSQVVLRAVSQRPDAFDGVVLHEPAVDLESSRAALPLLRIGAGDGIRHFLAGIGVSASEHQVRVMRRWSANLAREIESLHATELKFAPGTSGAWPRTAVLVGTHSPETVRDAAIAVHGQIAQSQMFGVQGAGHDAMLSHPRKFASACAKFLFDIETI